MRTLPTLSALRHTLAGLALCLGALAAPGAQAALTSYTVTGHFTGNTSDDATLVAAIAPLLGAGQALSLQLTLDTATAATGVTPGFGATIYPAVTASSGRFAGFDDATSSGCTHPSDFICSVHIESGLGGFADPDRVSVFPAILRSTALEAASGLGRLLSLQAMMFFNDFGGSAFASDAPDLDLSTLSLNGWTGQFGVFALKDTGGFDRASFEFSVDSIRLGAPDDNGGGHRVPEPASLALVLLALVLLGLGARAQGARRAG
ncbi:PEP-CTERM sorting domain-containing protein [Roseateles paludis]|jgi:hypothetical protein|uniref:PEP-CTERM sorting domain-containing protein n=1 Tax=Roseateles paludis TaxID=3145238 RepID=A0ABV0FXQ0_9BURK